MIRPTLRAVLMFAAGIPLALLLAALDPARWPLALDYGLLALLALVTDAALALPRRRLQATVEVPKRLFMGDTGTAMAVLTATGLTRATPVEALLEQAGPAEPASVATAILLPGAAARIAMAIQPLRRGSIAVHGLWLRWHGPLGLVQMVRRQPLNERVDVIPNLRAVKRVALQFLSRDAMYGIKAQQQQGEGSEFEALREYAPGLDSRFMDWKRSARHRKLLCKEFRTERNHQIVVAFDTGYLMSEPLGGMARLDHAVNAALALAWVSLASQDFVGCYAFDAAVRLYVPPSRGLATFARLQRSTAEIAYAPDETNFTLGLAELNVRLKRRGLVVLFTDFVDTVSAELLLDSLQRIANRHAVLFVTLHDGFLEGLVNHPPERFADVAGAVIAHDFLHDRAVVFQRLQRLGILCLDVAPGALSASLVNRYLMIKRQGLI